VSKKQWGTFLCTYGLNSSRFNACSALSSLPPSATGKLVLVWTADS